MSDMTVGFNANRISPYGVHNTAAKTTQSRTASVPADATMRTQDTVTISEEGQAAAQRTASVGSSSTAAVNTGETTFTSSANEIAALAKKHYDMSYDYYSKQLEESKKFADPRQHIRDKYKNEDSRYFRSDMTAAERDLAYENEISLMTSGRLFQAGNYNDYALRSVRHELALAGNTVVANQNARDQIEGAVNEALADNGITIPDGVSFRLSVDPYDHYISVLGLEDTSVAKLIEQVLNTGNNGRNLYYHIHMCNPEQFGYETPEQYTKLEELKSSLYQMVKDLSGLDIRTLERKNGTIYTPDGKDLWDVLTQAASTLRNNDGTSGADLSIYEEMYENIAKYGWTDGSGLALEYRNGSLYDIGTEYGYGDEQNGWTEWVLANPEAASMQMMPWVEQQAIELQVQREDDR